MATHQDLLDAINRVRTATGNRDAWQNGLSGDDIAAACNPFSSPAALGGVLTRIVAAHPAAFLAAPKPTETPPRTDGGLAAQAIRDAETALAQQNSSAAQVDLQVVSAVLNAQSANAVGAGELDRLQREIEAAVLSRSDLDTPAGAREFQRFLIGKLREIRTVVDTAGLDATSKAALAAALASLYACATPEPGPAGERREAESAESPPTSPRRGSAPPEPGEWAGSLPFPDPSEDLLSALPEFAAADAAGLPWDAVGPPLASAYQGAPQPPYPGSGSPPYPVGIPPASAGVPAMAPPAPAWGGGSPFGGGPPGWPDLGAPESFRDFGPNPGADGILREREINSPHRAESAPGDHIGDSAEGEEDIADESGQTAGESAEETGQKTGQETGEGTGEAAPRVVELPDGQMIIASTPQIAAAITAALAGTPVSDAFRQQGIGLPPPGSPVTAPLDATTLAPGDIGVFTDRHALALGNGTALLDNQIQPIPHVAGPGFLGWQHPPGPTMTTPTMTTPQMPAGPASTRPPAATAPS